MVSGCLCSTGLVLARQGKFARALQLQRSVVEERARSFGSDHERTLSSRLRLAIILHWSRNDDEARVLGEAVLETKERFGCHDSDYEQTKELLAAIGGT